MAPRVTKPSPPRKPRLIGRACPRCTMGENADPSEDEVIAMPRPAFFSHGTPNLVPIEGGRLVDARVAGPAEALLQACRAGGLDPVVTSAYRSPVRQAWILVCRFGANMLRGLSPCKAWRAARRYVALPGRSEHALGVALDISCGDGSPGGLEGIQGWLFENSWRFGFIRRYPPGKSALTGVDFEPWHYTYVGVDVATELRRTGECLEELAARLEVGRRRGRAAGLRPSCLLRTD